MLRPSSALVDRARAAFAGATVVGPVVALGLLAGCTVHDLPVETPSGDGPALIVGSASLPPPINDLARHPWVAFRRDGVWERWEVMCCADGRPGLDTVERWSDADPLSEHGGGGDVRVHAVFTGAEAVRMSDCVQREAPQYPHRHTYLVWPGPNSNTFVDWLLRRCDIPVDLPVASIGKDYRGGFGVSETSGGTGFQIETPIVGLRLGASEGLVLHFFTFSIGLDVWPPALILPAGRVGFADR